MRNYTPAESKEAILKALATDIPKDPIAVESDAEAGASSLTVTGDVLLPAGHERSSAGSAGKFRLASIDMAPRVARLATFQVEKQLSR